MALQAPRNLNFIRIKRVSGTEAAAKGASPLLPGTPPPQGRGFLHIPPSAAGKGLPLPLIPWKAAAHWINGSAAYL